jgi:hypothetical protein
VWIVTIIVIVFLLLTAAILFSKIKINIWIKKIGRDEDVVVKIRMLYGLIRLHYDLPMMKVGSLEDGIVLEVDKRNNIGQEEKSHNETQVNKRRIDHWINIFHQVLNATESFKTWSKRTMSRLSITNMEWSTNFSVGDAAYTAVASGMLWSTKTFIIGWLSHEVQLMDPPRVFVVPVFDDHPYFSSELSCIVQISCGYAIYAGLVLIVRVLKVKGGVEKWKTILSKD